MGSAQQAASHVAAEVGAASPTASVYSVLHGTRTHQQRDEQTRCNDRTTAWGTGRTGPLTSGRAAWRRCSLRTRRAPSTAPDRAGPAQPCAGAGVSEPASGEKSQQRDGAPSSAPAGGTAAVCLLCWVRGRSARACVVRQRPRGPAQLSGYVCISPAGCGEIQGSPIRSLMLSDGTMEPVPVLFEYSYILVPRKCVMCCIAGIMVFEGAMQQRHARGWPDEAACRLLQELPMRRVLLLSVFSRAWPLSSPGLASTSASWRTPPCPS